MKIDPTIQLGGGELPQRVKNASTDKSEGTANASGLSSAAGEDTVQLSSTHNAVQTLTASLSSVPEVRIDRVQALRQQVRSGGYAPDSQKVADALIQDHAKFGTKA